MISVIEIDTPAEEYLHKHTERLIDEYPRGCVLRDPQLQTLYLVEYIGQRAELIVTGNQGKKYVVYGLVKKTSRGRKPKGVEV